MAQLSQPLWEKGGKADKIHVNKKGRGTSSPDHAESIMYAFAVPRADDQAGPSANVFLAVVRAAANSRRR